LELLLRAAGVVAAAHEAGVVHLYLKPDHLIYADDGDVFVVDWDAARLLERRPRRREFGLCGTPEYMAPEQAAGDLAHISRRTDVFALGVILFEVLHGRRMRPIRDTLLEALRQAAGRHVRCAAKVRRRWPASAQLCAAALAPQPRRRPRDARMFARRLAAALRRDWPLASSADALAAESLQRTGPSQPSLFL
jgi:serine/threonine-protein kinase